MNKQEKHAEVKFLGEKLKESQIALVADYRGLSVTAITELRKKLFDSKAGSRVVKNTLAKRAVMESMGSGQVNVDDQGAELKKFIKELTGPTFLVYSDVDPIEPAKIIEAFNKAKEAAKSPILSVRGAWVDGTFLDAKGVEALSKMPGKQEVLSTLLRLLNTPATNLVRLLNAPAQQTVQVVEAARRKLEG